MAYSSKAVANYLLDLAEEEGQSLSPMKLQKLVYFAHGWHLAVVGVPLVHEQVEAWKWGPVIRSLYYEFREFGNQSISGRAIHFSMDGPGFEFDQTTPSIDEEAADAEDANRAKALLKKVWDVYKEFTAIQLSKMTHEVGSPWDKVFQKYSGDPPKGTDIPEDSIREHFTNSP